MLVARGECVDLELAALSNAGDIVALGIDAEAAAIFAVAGPGNDKVSDRVGGDRRQLLRGCRIGVDRELRTRGHERGHAERAHEVAAGSAVGIAVERAAVGVEHRLPKGQLVGARS